MLEYRLGYFATSLCGHDKNRLYMIVSEDEQTVGLCDGVHRFLANPKRKKKKHVQMIRSEQTAADFARMLSSGDADEQIRAAVRKQANKGKEQEDGKYV